MKFKPSNIKLLGIDDDEELIEVMKLFFEANKDVVPKFEMFSDSEKFLKAMTPDVQICIIDYFLKGEDGLGIVKKVIEKNPYCWFIMFTGQQNLNVVVSFMNAAYGTRYVEKGTVDVFDKLLYYIQDIKERISILEKFFYDSQQIKETLADLKGTINELKASL